MLWKESWCFEKTGNRGRAGCPTYEGPAILITVGRAPSPANKFLTHRLIFIYVPAMDRAKVFLKFIQRLFLFANLSFISSVFAMAAL